MLQKILCTVLSWQPETWILHSSLSTISFSTTINIASNIILHSYIHSTYIHLFIFILYRFVWNLNNTRDIFSYSFKSILQTLEHKKSSFNVRSLTEIDVMTKTIERAFNLVMCSNMYVYMCEKQGSL